MMTYAPVDYTGTHPNTESTMTHGYRTRRSMMAKQYMYWIPSEGETEEDAREIRSELIDDDGPRPEANDFEEAAEKAAQHYYDFHDGWDSHWPLDMAVSDGTTVKVFTVEREATVAFHAVEKDAD